MLTSIRIATLAGFAVLAVCSAPCFAQGDEPAKESKAAPMPQPPSPLFIPGQDAHVDPALKAAGFAHEEIRKNQEKVRRTLDGIKHRLDQIKPGLDTARVEKETLGDFKRVARLLREQASAILSSETAVLGDLQIYAGSLERAPRSFMSAADSFAKRSENARAPKVKDAYTQMAAAAKKWAGSMEAQKKDADLLGLEMGAKFGLVRESLVFLDDFENFLQIFPDAEKKLQIRAYIESMDAYVAGIESTVAQVRRLTSGEPAGTPMPPPESKDK